jgi:hypothetical protein
MGALPNPFLTIFGISRGRVIDHGVFAIGNARLPSDAIGTASVTFDGVNAGSEIRVYLPGSIEAAGVEICAADHTLTWGAYSAGSVNNTVRIVIIHPDYKIKEFEYVSSVGNQSIPVQQERDMWYSNPV